MKLVLRVVSRKFRSSFLSTKFTSLGVNLPLKALVKLHSCFYLVMLSALLVTGRERERERERERDINAYIINNTGHDYGHTCHVKQMICVLGHDSALIRLYWAGDTLG